MKNIQFKAPTKKTWILIACLILFSTALIFQWDTIFKQDNDELNSIVNELYRLKVSDSVRIAVLSQNVTVLTDANNKLRDAVTKNIAQIEKLKIASVNKQYEVFQYNASNAGQYFLNETGGDNRPPEIVLRQDDTCMITPIQNITEANIKFVQLEYTVKERDEYVTMTGNLNDQIKNFQQIVTGKDSIITIQNGELTLSQQAVDGLKKANEQANKKEKKLKTKLYIASGTAILLGLIAILK